MVGASKILTVSYGTFSCTLEGFDEPFGTMRAIAEYFRDLAAQDRYFGAEPPTPDAEMLHRIAEREGRRSVEARVEPEGIVLRAAAPVREAAPLVAEQTAARAETLAEKLRRLRAAVAEAEAEAHGTRPGEVAEPAPAGGADFGFELDAGAARPHPSAPAPDPFDEDEEDGFDGLGASDAAGAPRGDAGDASKLPALAARLRAFEESAAQPHGTRPQKRPTQAPDVDENLLRQIAAESSAPSEEPEATPSAPAGRSILEQQTADDAAVGRLMDEARSKLEGPENKRRFSAIAHLKAAVAATVAERKFGGDDARDDDAAVSGAEMDRYRDDLSRVVKPRPAHPSPKASAPSRPSASQPKDADSAVAAAKASLPSRASEAKEAPETRRPEPGADEPAAPASADLAQPRAEAAETAAPPQRPAPPLVLVSDQRVPDREGPARRRQAEATRILRDDEMVPHRSAPAPEAGSFAEFAERLGAQNLAELLEAAAAYTAAIEGTPHFSRPQLLRKVAAVAEDTDFSREDGLRSFGMLLRQGKIQKVRRGQFTITDASHYLTEAQRGAV